MKTLLLTAICTIILHNTLRSQSKTTEVEIIANYGQLNTVSQLLSTFKGKPVFLDLWATWCEPCKDEFKFSDELYIQLQQRDVQLLYVSLYKEVIDSVWRSDIKKFRLKGKHVKANKTLQDALATLIWGAPGGFSIPRYLLFNANGKLLLNDTLPPSTGFKLLEQIDSKLRQ